MHKHTHTFFAWLRAPCATRPFAHYARWEAVAVAVMVILAAAVRMFRFGDIPYGLNQDEASTLYDSWSLFHYGVDRHGYPWPVMLVSWGSGMYALASYAAFPGIALFGLQAEAVRFPHLLLGLLSLPVFFIMIREITDKKTALVGLFLLSISPWHIMISRWGLDSNLLPPLFLAGFTCLLLARRTSAYLTYSAVLFALCLYAYGTAYVLLPVFFALALPVVLRDRSIPAKTIVYSTIIILVLALPIAIYLAINRFDLHSVITPFFSIPRLTGVARYDTSGVIPGLTEGAFAKMQLNLSRVFTLFYTQSDGTGYNVLHEYGVMYVWSLPFLLMGLGIAAKDMWRRMRTPLALLFAWIVSGIILGAMLDPPNVNRMNVIFFPFIALIAIGVRSIMRRPLVATGIVLMFLVSFARFTSAYLGPQAPRFNASLPNAIRMAAESTDGPVCVTEHAAMPYIYGLIATATNPHGFAQTALIDNPGGEFQFVSAFDRFTFGIQRCDMALSDAFVLAPGESSYLTEDPAFLVRQVGEYAVALRIHAMNIHAAAR